MRLTIAELLDKAGRKSLRVRICHRKVGDAGEDVARMAGKCANVVWSAFSREVLGDANLRRLCYPVSVDVGGDSHSSGRRYDDIAPTAVLDHRRHERVDHVHTGPYVNLLSRPPAIGIDIPNWPEWPGHSSIVDDQRDRAVSVLSNETLAPLNVLSCFATSAGIATALPPACSMRRTVSSISDCVRAVTTTEAPAPRPLGVAMGLRPETASAACHDGNLTIEFSDDHSHPLKALLAAIPFRPR